MSMTEKMTSYIGTLIMVIIVLLVFFYIINYFTGGKLVRLLVCGVLFWLPFGTSVAEHCAAIPV